MTPRTRAAPAVLALLCAACSAPPTPPVVTPPMPAVDLAVSAPADGAPPILEWRNFDPAWCDVARGCVGAAGDRALLHFRFRVTNQGSLALDLSRDAELVAACTDAPATSVLGFARWELLDSTGAAVRQGLADAHCIKDDVPEGGAFTCTAQGLSSGFSSTQPGMLSGACTFADVSGLAAGAYQVRITVNPDGSLPDSNRTNDSVTLDVTLPDTQCRGQQCGTDCCPPNTPCAPQGGCLMPDLTVDVEELKKSISYSVESFPANDCALEELCVSGPGDRKLVRFTTSTPNVGTADFYIGDPEKSPRAVYAECHGHYHYLQYSDYRLVAADGGTVATGRKQAFCAFDHTKLDPDAGRGKYSCTNQGITTGWTDIYESYLDCQWIDVTDVEPGDYTLEVEVNPTRHIAEANYVNNVGRVPVKVPAGDGCVPINEQCADGQDNDCDGLIDENCGNISGNDTCARPFYLHLPGEYRSELKADTQSALTQSCGAAAGGNLVYHFSLMVPELVYLSTYGSAVDTVLSVHDGTCASADTACEDDGCGTGQQHLAKVMQPGPHYVVVKAKNAGETGIVRLNFQKSTCIDAKRIDAPGIVTGDSSQAPDNFFSACGAEGGLGRGGRDELWWLASCPGQTSLTASTCLGTGFDTAVFIKQGSCRGRDVACNNDACGVASSAQVTMNKPGLWFIGVDGVGQGVGGPYTLELEY
ncbi:MAG: hypothetical protein JNK82_10805 [Myxococcaceae bacterium]|nr:hypothetical protein [Myxococcaceae bacterium]